MNTIQKLKLRLALMLAMAAGQVSAGSVIKAGEGHMQIWDGGAVTGKVYQDITLPNGEYTLTSGCYATFKGSVSMYANNEKVDIISGKSPYYTVVVNVTDENLQIGLNINTTGETDIEWDHVVLTPGNGDVPPTTSISIKENNGTSNNRLFSINDIRLSAPLKGLNIKNGKKVLTKQPQ